MGKPIMHAAIAPINRINSFIGFTGATESFGANNPSNSINATAGVDDVTDSAATAVAADINFLVAAAFNSPIDADFVIEQATGGSHNDESIFPVLDYESEDESSHSISRGMDTPAAVFMALPTDTAAAARTTATAGATATGAAATTMVDCHGHMRKERRPRCRHI
jgi:hypothetical protein